MKTRYIFALMLPIAACMACAKVNDDYDFDKGIDKSLKVASGIEVEVNQETEVSIGSLLDVENTGDFQFDESGNCVLSGSSKEGKISQTADASEANVIGKKFPINGSLTNTFESYPDFFKDENNYLHINNPSLAVAVTNTSGSKLKFAGVAKAYNKEGAVTKTVNLEMDNVPAGCHDEMLIFKNEDITDLYNPIPEKIVIDQMYLEVTVPASGANSLRKKTTASTSFEYAVDCISKIPLEIAKGQTLDYEFSFDSLGFNLSSAIDEMNKALNNSGNSAIDLRSCSVFGTAVSTIPLDFRFSAQSTDGTGVSISMDKDILGGRPGSSATTDFAIKIVLPDGISTIDGAKVAIHAAPAGDEDAVLNRENSLSLKLNRVKFDDGILIDLNGIEFSGNAE